MTGPLRVIDSHTAGEPTRVVIAGGPDLGDGPLAERRDRFDRDHAAFGRAVVCEPRGHDAIVGALLLPPADMGATAAVLFFNPVGTLGMCGHGTIGLLATLAHLGHITPGAHRIETPVGCVEATLHDTHRASLANVPSYVHAERVAVDVPLDAGPRRVVGDVAWGGNGFFIADWPHTPIDAGHIEPLTREAKAIRRALRAAGVTEAGGGPIDHIELVTHDVPDADARSFVLCPGGAYDRSPCGTGTSATLAVQARRGTLRPGQRWVQQSVLGTAFEASYEPIGDGRIVATITGEAFVTAETTLIRQHGDPFRDGLSVGDAS